MANVYGYVAKFSKKSMSPIYLAVVSDCVANVFGFSSSHRENGDLVNAAIENIDSNFLKNIDGYIDYSTLENRCYTTYKHYDFASKYKLHRKIIQKQDEGDFNFDCEFSDIKRLIEKFEQSEFYNQFSNLEEFNFIFSNFLRVERCKNNLDSMPDKDVREILKLFLELSFLSISNKIGNFKLIKNDLNLGLEANLRPNKLMDIRIHQFGNLVKS